MKESIWIGFDSREATAYAVAVHSIRQRLSRAIPIMGLSLPDLQRHGLYTRPTETKHPNGYRHLYDIRSKRDDYDGAMSTEFALSRFLIPHLAGSGWAVFMDCDILARGDLARLFALRDPTKAVQVVKHDYVPHDSMKMDGQKQAAYSRKNWSSVILWNLDHPAHHDLTLQAFNNHTGRDLHQFCWLSDDLIGDLPIEWNWLADESPPTPDPMLVHHTLGSPCLPGYEEAPYADEWREVLKDWAVHP